MYPSIVYTHWYNLLILSTSHRDILAALPMVQPSTGLLATTVTRRTPSPPRAPRSRLP